MNFFEKRVTKNQAKNKTIRKFLKLVSILRFPLFIKNATKNAPNKRIPSNKTLIQEHFSLSK